MANALLGVVTEALLTKAISLANERISGVLGVKEDLQSLSKQLELIQALLSDAQSKSTSSGAVQLWLKELEDTATDADDLLDEFAYQVQSKKMLKGKRNKVRNFFSSSNPLLFRFKMVSEIKKINLQMDKIFKNANQIGLRPAEIMNFPTDPTKVPLTYPFVDDSKIVGRDDDVNKIVSQLTCSKDGKNLSVIGIVAMGGQGKTTLAQLLMKKDVVKKHFEKTVWTCVSDNFDVDRVFKDMLEYLTEEASQVRNRKVIVEKLSKELRGKRFLLVLDDVWNEDSQLWEDMNNSLQAIGGSEGSKIIVTTRNELVVTTMKGFVHHLGVLSDEDSQKLFEKIAFGNGSAAKNPRLVEIGKRIVARCGGVPLALKAIGGLLSSQRDELEWVKIEESSVWSALDGVQSAIELSFNHLPYLSLKKCFAYCSVFPKDWVIEKDVTIQQWMAHGLLNPSSRSDLEMEDIGNNYFRILLQRSLLQEAEFDEYGNITSCKMHDLVHDFALETSKEHCLTAKVGELSADTKAVHLLIVCDGSDNINISSEKIFCRLRTLHLFGDFSCENFLVHCKCLRVLTLANREMRELPISIAKMKHLRYLDIFETCIRALPEFISKLYNLQTLRLPRTVDLPKDFVGSVKLRHLDIEERYHMNMDVRYPLIPGIGEMTSLRTLNWFRVSREEGFQIKELCNLKHLEGSLTIAGLENVANEDDARRANLSGKRNIESLELKWSSTANTEASRNDESILEGLQPHLCLKALEIVNCIGTSPPSWLPGLHNLMSLKLDTLANCEQIPPLGHLQVLKILHIEHMENVKVVGNDFYGCPNMNLVIANSVVVFPSLKELSFNFMDSLEEWSDIVQPSFVSSSSSSVELFPCLENFEISSCPQLTYLPEGLLSASTGLESLSIKSCDKLVSIPDLSSLRSLKMLDIFSCDKLVSIPDLSNLCSLKRLHISAFNELVSIPDLSSLHSLEELYISSCHKLVSIPDLSSLHSLKKLHMFFCDKLVSIPDLSSLHSLEELFMSHCDKLVSIPDLSSLYSLKVLDFSNCGKLSSLPRGIEACRSLQKLRITCSASCLMESLFQSLTNLKSLTLTLSDNIIDHQMPTGPISNTVVDDIQGYDAPFSTLESLSLSGMPHLKSLPEQIQLFTALRDLRLHKFEGLETLPEWLSNFHPLRSLSLEDCNSLVNLPEWLGNFHSLEGLQLRYCNSLANFSSVEVMRGLTNLKSLSIFGCPILEQRCEREGGVEWHKIAHIPEINGL